MKSLALLRPSRRSYYIRDVGIAIAAAAGVWMWCSNAAAIIVIDDFNDPVVVEEVDGVATSSDVGDLSARRGTHFAASKASGGAAGRLDIGTETPGIATTTLISAGNRPLFGDVSAGFHFIYDGFFGVPLTTFDFTEGGRNDAVIVDVLSITGETLPRVARVQMNDYTGSVLHEHLIFNLPETIEPSRLVFPFDELVPRRGATGLPPLDFERISTVWLAFGSNFLQTEGQVEQWEIKLDRIWVGPSSAVPEPQTMIIVLLVAACCAPRVFRHVTGRRVDHDNRMFQGAARQGL